MIFTFIVLSIYLIVGFAVIVLTNKRAKRDPSLDGIIHICVAPLVFGLTLAPAAMITEAKSESYYIVEYDKDIASVELDNNEYNVVFKDHSTVAISVDKTIVTEHGSFDPCVIKFVEVKNTGWLFGIGKVKTGVYKYEIYVKPGTQI